MKKYRLYRYLTDALNQEPLPEVWEDDPAFQHSLGRIRSGEWVVQVEKDGLWRNHSGPYATRKGAQAAKPKRVANVFPPAKRGGYTARLRFMDEDRDEQYFDQSWAIHNPYPAGKFTIIGPTGWDGQINYDHNPARSIGRDLHVGDQLTVIPKKWNQTGQPRELPGVTIVITEVRLAEDTGYVRIGYKYPS